MKGKHSMKEQSTSNMQKLTAWRGHAVGLAILLAAAAAAPARAQTNSPLAATNLPSTIPLQAVLAALGSTNAAVVMSQQITGTSALATFSHLDETGCVWTDVYVSASLGTVFDSFSKRNTVRNVTVVVSMYDVCLGVLTNSIAGHLSEDNFLFEIDHKLGWARLIALVPTCDMVSTNCFDLLVVMEWWATGSATHEVVTLVEHVPGYLLTIHANGDLQGAFASGSVTSGDWNMTPNPSDYAVMDSATVRDLTVENQSQAPQP